MKQPRPAPTSPPLRPRRLGLAEAKSKLAEVVREATATPTIIHSRGHDLAVILAVAEYERLVADRPLIAGPAGGGAGFLARVEALRQRHGGGVDDFEPGHLALTPEDPFARPRRRRA